MRLGPLRHRITFQSRMTTRDEFGQPVEGWELIADVWASVEPISGKEQIAGQQVLGEVSHRVRCRYLPGLETADRILFDGRPLEIRALINPREVNAMLEILATEGLTDGR